MLTLCALCTQLSCEGVEPQGFPSKKKAHVARCVQHTHGERLCVLSSFVPYAFLPRVTAAAAAEQATRRGRPAPGPYSIDPPAAVLRVAACHCRCHWQPVPRTAVLTRF